MAGALARWTCCARWPNARDPAMVRPQFVPDPASTSKGPPPRGAGATLSMSSACLHRQRHAAGPKHRMQVITGPNMGGKSTYMRQVALIVLLASMGSYVPATACRLGPIDAIHTRIGAADDLANAQSTFMLEMTEAAQILHSATPHSLGAHAVCHPLLRADRIPGPAPPGQNVHVGATESGRDIIFLHEIQAWPGQQELWAACGAPWLECRRWCIRPATSCKRWRRQQSQQQVDLFAAPRTGKHRP